MPFPAFWARVQAMRNWAPGVAITIRQVHEGAASTVAAPHGMGAIVRELRRIVDRVDGLAQQRAAVSAEIHELLADIDEAQYLATLPGIGWV
jgi:DNA-binding GntR family transcriptional regulator